MNKLPESIEGLNFDYVYGMTFKNGAERIYKNSDIGVQINLNTLRDKNGVWGKGVKSYSIIGSKRFYDSYEELLQEHKDDDE